MTLLSNCNNPQGYEITPTEADNSIDQDETCANISMVVSVMKPV